MTRLLTRAEIAEGRRLVEKMFEGPWRYNQWLIECRACDGGTTYNSDLEGGCTNPDCDGTHAPATFVEAPHAYPADDRRPQVVATIDVPGIDTLAQGNGEAICWLRNHAPALLAGQQKLAEMRAALDWLAMNDLRSAGDPVDAVFAYAESLGWKRP